MAIISGLTYGKDYADNLIDDLLQFNIPQTWTVSSGTGSASLNTTILFEGKSCLELFNTAPTTDLTVTNSVQSTIIPYGGDFIFSCYLKKKDILNFIDVGIQLFQGAAPLAENVFRLGSEDAEEDFNLDWIRFQSPVYDFNASDEITIVLTVKGKVGTALSTTTVWADGFMLSDAKRLSLVVPNYNKPDRFKDLPNLPEADGNYQLTVASGVYTWTEII